MRSLSFPTIPVIFGEFIEVGREQEREGGKRNKASECAATSRCPMKVILKRISDSKRAAETDKGEREKD